jgi:hypothetical protein
MWYDNQNTTNPFNHTTAGDAGWLVFRANLRQVPEPTTALMLGIGLFGLGLSGRQQKSTRHSQSLPLTEREALLRKSVVPKAHHGAPLGI